MNISKNNYEAYLLDHLEGRLSKEEQMLLKQFILDNPELGDWDELNSELPELYPSTAIFTDKELLLKQEIRPFKKLNETNFNDFFISFHEGLLSANEQQELEAFLELNPFLQGDFDLYDKVYFKADEKQVYPNKKKLLRLAPVIGLGLIRNISIAASLLLLASIAWIWLQPETKVVSPEMVVVAPEVKTPVVEEIFNEAETTATFQTATNESTSTKTREAISDEQEFSFFKPLEALPALAFREAGQIIESGRHNEIPVMQHVSDRLLLAAVISGNDLEEQAANKSAFGRVFDNTVNKVLASLAPNKSTDKPDNVSDVISGGFSLWDLAQAGVKTYNTLTDNDVQLVKATDEQGRISGMRFNSDKLNFNRSFDKKLEN
ncbi:MAG: hypothetical protein Q8J88_15820 [Bacteroidales bacterium]|nr:hypothetical protein [Bacteroidales bacterium]